MTVANSNLTVGYKSFQQAGTGSGATRTITPLFPYASGYQVWAGDCADADPAAHTGGSRGAVLASNPGATTSGSAALDAVDVTVRRHSGPRWPAGHHQRHPRRRHRLHRRRDAHPTTTRPTPAASSAWPCPTAPGPSRATIGSGTASSTVDPRPGLARRPGPDRGDPVTLAGAPHRDQAGVTMVEMAVVVALLGAGPGHGLPGAHLLPAGAAGARHPPAEPGRGPDESWPC